MKHVFGAVALIVLLAMPGIAQERTLLNGPVSHGFYGGIDVTAGPSAEGISPFVGVEGAWILDHQVIMGFAFRGLGDLPVAPQNPDWRYSMGYGGLMLGWNAAPMRLVHLNFRVVAGGGVVTVFDPDYEGDRWDSDYHWDRYDRDRHHLDKHVDTDGFLAIEPGVSAILNLHSLVRIGAGVSYRHVYGVDSQGMNDANWTGIMPHLTILIGWF